MSLEIKDYIEYIPEGDILYLHFNDNEIAKTVERGIWNNIDLDADGKVVAMEFVGVSDLKASELLKIIAEFRSKI